MEPLLLTYGTYLLCDNRDISGIQYLFIFKLFMLWKIMNETPIFFHKLNKKVHFRTSRPLECL